MNEYLSRDASACLVRQYENPQLLATGIRRVCEHSQCSCTIRDSAVKIAQRFDRRIVDAAEVAIYGEAMKLEPRPITSRLGLAGWRAWKTTTASVEAVVPKLTARTMKRQMLRLWR